ncbi:hypothetical protein BH09GEM1_BH09GEM1_11100 [soil metagenome]
MPAADSPIVREAIANLRAFLNRWSHRALVLRLSGSPGGVSYTLRERCSGTGTTDVIFTVNQCLILRKQRLSSA